MDGKDTYGFDMFYMFYEDVSMRSIICQMAVYPSSPPTLCGYVHLMHTHNQL